MSSHIDPLTQRSSVGTDRLNFAPGMLLDAQDFSDEQTYHRSRSAMALAHLFGSGTLWGLRVDWDSGDREVQVRAGLALDGFGRLIEVPRRACMGIEGWFAAQRDEDLRESWLDDPVSQRAVLIADVFVRFHVCQRGKTPAFRTGPFDALDAVASSRLRDAYELALVVRPEALSVRQGTEPELPSPRWEAQLEEFMAQDAAARIGTIRRLLDLDLPLQPPPLPEHLRPAERAGIEDDPTEVGRDTSSVWLARMRLPLVQRPATPEERPVLDIPAIGAPDNFSRRFVYAPSVLIGLLGG